MSYQPAEKIKNSLNQLTNTKNSATENPLLNLLHKQFFNRRQELLVERTAWAKKNKPNLVLEQLDTTLQIRTSHWKTEAKASGSDLQMIHTNTAFYSINQHAHVVSNSAILDFEDGGIVSITQNGLNLQGLKTEGRVFRVRGLSSDEKTILIEGRTVPAPFLDLAMCFLSGIPRGFVIPKIESALEARFWSDIFFEIEKHHQIPRGSLELCVEIETVRSVLELHEILFELKERVTSVRWDARDYAFSLIKLFSTHPQFILPQILTPIDRDKAFFEIKNYIHQGALKRGLSFFAQEPSVQETNANTIPVYDQGVDQGVGRYFIKFDESGSINLMMIRDSILFCLGYLDYWLFSEQHAEYTKILNQKDIADFELTRSLLWHWHQKSILTHEMYTQLKDQWLTETKGIGEAAARLLDTLILNSSLAETSEPFVWSAYRKLQGAQTHGMS